MSDFILSLFIEGTLVSAVLGQERSAGDRIQKSAVIEKERAVDDICVVQHSVVGDLAQMRCAFRLIRDLVGGGRHVERFW